MPTNLDEWEVIAEGVKPDAAIAFWQYRAKLTWPEAKALAEGAKQRAFYATGLARQDLVNLVSDGIQAALENGETLPKFKERILAAIQSQGWHSHRIETIFRTNLQSAYAAGRYKKMQAVKASRPYWQYLAVMDRRVRPSHAVLHEKVYPADHEFWSSNYPPNGFRCRCAVVTLSERQVKAQGLTVETEMPKADVWTDPKTGMEYFVHFPGADNGFRNNPFKAWASGGGAILPMFAERLESANPETAKATIKTLVKGGFEHWRKNPKGNFPLCAMKKEDAAQIGAKKTIAVISAETMAKQDNHHPELTVDDYALAQEAVDRGEKIQQDERNIAYVLNLPGGVVVIVKATRDGEEVYATSLRRLSRKPVDILPRLKARDSYR